MEKVVVKVFGFLENFSNKKASDSGELFCNLKFAGAILVHSLFWGKYFGKYIFNNIFTYFPVQLLAFLHIFAKMPTNAHHSSKTFSQFTPQFCRITR